jgi:hypothetical protein
MLILAVVAIVAISYAREQGRHHRWREVRDRRALETSARAEGRHDAAAVFAEDVSPSSNRKLRRNQRGA